MSPKWRNRLIFVLIVAGIITALRFTIFKPEPIDVSAYAVETGLVEETVTNSKAGTVRVRKRANLSTEIGGRVVYLGVKEGDRVQEGQLLLRLDPTEQEASVKLSKRAAEAADAAAKEACATRDLAVRELRRNRELHAQGVISDSVLDQSANRSEAAEANCEARRAETNRAYAAIEVAQAALSKTQLHAPFNGVVVQVTTELGEWITPSPPGVPIPPVIDILDDSRIYVEAPIDETDAAKLRLGLPVRISLDPFPDQTFHGTLTRIAPFVRDIEGQNRTVDVESEFTGKDVIQKLLAGTSADIEIILTSRQNVLRIPTYALMEGSRVLVIENDTLVLRNIKSGLRNWDYVEVVEGLKKGEVITVSLELAEVKEGAKVTVTETINQTAASSGAGK
jgi:HlyD family secretion protein